MIFIQKSFILLFLLNFYFTICYTSPDVGTYDTKYDNIDLDEMLNNERLLKNYIKCLLNEGPCTPDARSLKDTIPDAMQTDCSKCSEKQKYGVDKVNHFLIENKPEEWEKLEKKYDTEGVYRKRYLESKSKLNDTQTENTTVKVA